MNNQSKKTKDELRQEITAKNEEFAKLSRQLQQSKSIRKIHNLSKDLAGAAKEIEDLMADLIST